MTQDKDCEQHEWNGWEDDRPRHCIKCGEEE